MTPQAPESNEDVSNATGTRGGTASVWQGGSKFGGSITLTTGGKLRFGNSVKGTHNDAQIRQEGSEFTPKVVGGEDCSVEQGNTVELGKPGPTDEVVGEENCSVEQEN